MSFIFLDLFVLMVFFGGMKNRGCDDVVVFSDRRLDDFSSPINQWISSPFCQLDIMSPNDGSLAFSISSPVQLSPYLPASALAPKSPMGDFSPSIFSSLKESAFLDDIDSVQSRKSGEFVFDDELDLKSPLFGQQKHNIYGLNPSPGAAAITAANLRTINFKKTSLYGRPSTRYYAEDTEQERKLQRTGYGTDLFQQTRIANAGSESKESDGSFAPSAVGRSASRASAQESMTSPEAVTVKASKSSTGRSTSSGSANRSRATAQSQVEVPSAIPLDPASVGTPSAEEGAKCNCKKSKCLKLYVATRCPSSEVLDNFLVLFCSDIASALSP
jgi:hypothetical protein